jgi:F0F1-type ATP synthase epsilon subunit
VTYFICDIHDEHLDTTVIYDFECEVEVEVIVSGGQITTSISDVTVDNRSLFLGDELTRALAAKVANLAEEELNRAGRLWDRVQQEQGVEFTGRNANDPDGEWRKAA